jgi:hypothetical protein
LALAEDVEEFASEFDAAVDLNPNVETGRDSFSDPALGGLALKGPK